MVFNDIVYETILDPLEGATPRVPVFDESEGPAAAKEVILKVVKSRLERKIVELDMNNKPASRAALAFLLAGREAREHLKNVVDFTKRVVADTTVTGESLPFKVEFKDGAKVFLILEFEGSGHVHSKYEGDRIPF